MKRRIFIKFSAYTAAAVAIPALNACNQKPINTAIAAPQFLKHFLDSKAIIETGHAYLKQVPSENNKNKLSDLLTSDASLRSTSDTKTVFSYFDKKTRQDFEAGKITVVDGWVLSVTEARQCALFALAEAK